MVEEIAIVVKNARTVVWEVETGKNEAQELLPPPLPLHQQHQRLQSPVAPPRAWLPPARAEFENDYGDGGGDFGGRIEG